MEPDLRNKRCATEVMVTVKAERDRGVLLHAEAEETVDRQAYNTT